MKMYYYGARYYDPEISMWISVDPAINKYLPDRRMREEDINRLPGGGGIYNSKNLAVYSYSHNNPVVLIDPDGKEVVGGLISGIAVGWATYTAARYSGDTKRASLVKAIGAGVSTAILISADITDISTIAAVSGAFASVSSLGAQLVDVVSGEKNITDISAGEVLADTLITAGLSTVGSVIGTSSKSTVGEVAKGAAVGAGQVLAGAVIEKGIDTNVNMFKEIFKGDNNKNDLIIVDAEGN